MSAVASQTRRAGRLPRCLPEAQVLAEDWDERTGKRAPPRTESRVKLGMRNPSMKASQTQPRAEQPSLSRLSRSKPVTRLMSYGDEKRRPPSGYAFGLRRLPILVAAPLHSLAVLFKEGTIVMIPA